MKDRKQAISPLPGFWWKRKVLSSNLVWAFGNGVRKVLGPDKFRLTIQTNDTGLYD
jgi:hypothetical protein